MEYFALIFCLFQLLLTIDFDRTTTHLFADNATPKGDIVVYVQMQ